MPQVRYSLPLVIAKQAFASVLPHISTDDVTPVITCANFDGKSIVATDRYTVAQHTLGEEDAGEAVMLPRAAVAWVARTNLRALLNHPNPASYYLDIVSDSTNPQHYQPGETPPRPHRLAIRSKLYGEERVMLFEHIRGNFPPVARLLDGFEAATEAYPVMLAPKMIERITGFARQYHPEQAIKWELGKTDSPKPAPMRASIHGFTALIQPNLMLK